MKAIYKKYSSLNRAVDNANRDNWEEYHAIKTREEEFSLSLPKEVLRQVSRAYNQRYIYITPINQAYQNRKKIVEGNKQLKELGFFDENLADYY